MDVHDLARALCRATCTECDRTYQGRNSCGDGWRECLPEAERLLPLIEAHTRAAVEAERAACEAVVAAFLETREMLGLVETVICDECCPTTWVTAEGQPHCKLHEDIRAVLFNHEATRGAIAARKAQP